MRIAAVLFTTAVVFVSMGGECMAALRVTVFDVGMGQSLFLEDDGYGILIDTGVADQAPRVLKRMKALGLQQLDYLMLTHLHPDHAAAFPQIRLEWPLAVVKGNCHLPDSVQSSEQDTAADLHALLQKDSRYGCLAAGDVIYWRGHTLNILWPDTLIDKTNLNAASLVILLTTKEGRRLLVMGDVDKSVEPHIAKALRQFFQTERVDLFIAGHHAAADSCSTALLQEITPLYSVVSVGVGNPYGYPDAKSMAVLKKYSQTVLRTDQEGEICFVMEAGGIVPCETFMEKKGQKESRRAE